MSMKEVSDQIQSIINRLLEQKGQPAVTLTDSSRFLSGGIPIDSLDLAVLVTELQAVTGKDPFAAGFRNFQTVGELAAMYAE
jgi:acyl carrier protein